MRIVWYIFEFLTSGIRIRWTGTIFSLGFEKKLFKDSKSGIRVRVIWTVSNSGLEFQDFELGSWIRNAIGRNDRKSAEFGWRTVRFRFIDVSWVRVQFKKSWLCLICTSSIHGLALPSGANSLMSRMGIGTLWDWNRNPVKQIQILLIDWHSKFIITKIFLLNQFKKYFMLMLMYYFITIIIIDTR